MSKAIKNTHRHPANRVLHVIGLLLYVVAIFMISGSLLGTNVNPFSSLYLFMVAIALFLLGHKIEGNVRATTWVVLFKYLKECMRNRKKLK
ncbi:MAG TPA: Mpo1-like protein [Phototrophicaceae bacterium]|nr:Mpo1-like protein [Phototrophicaceae bacterium]